MKSHLFCNSDLEKAQTFKSCDYRIALFANRGPEKKHNEDSAGVIEFDEDICILVVADGLGGMSDGEIASSLVVEELCNRNIDDVEAHITQALQECNRRLINRSPESATTAIVATIIGNELRAYLIGDSSICVIGQRGKLKYQNTPHAPVSEAFKAGILSEKEAMFHHERYMVSNVLGSPDMYVEKGPAIKLAPRDTLLISSDGVFDNLYMAEIIELVRKGPLVEAADALQKKTAERMSQWPPKENPAHPDDTTFILLRLTGK